MITLEEWEANCKSHEFDRVYAIEVDYIDDSIDVREYALYQCKFSVDFLGERHLIINYDEYYLRDVFFSKEEAEKHATFDNYPYRLDKK